MRSSVLLLAVALLALPLAGCFGAEKVPSERTVKAGSGKVSATWAYDGAGLEGGDATLEGLVNNPDNKGAFFANFTYKGAKYAVVFDAFQQAEGKAFQDGGVAFNLDEHGATGHGDAALPKLHALVAAWGTATVTKDGMPVVGKAGPAWMAHLMVFDDAVRGADGKITKADGATPYDAATPEDAKTLAGQKQALLRIVSPDGENAVRAPVRTDKNLTFQGPESSQTVEIPVEMGALPFVITVNATGGANPVALGQIKVDVKAGEKSIGSDAGTPVVPNQPYSKTFEVKADNLANGTSKIVVTISGTGAFAAQVVATVAYADVPQMVVTWDNPIVS